MNSNPLLFGQQLGQLLIPASLQSKLHKPISQYIAFYPASQSLDSPLAIHQIPQKSALICRPINPQVPQINQIEGHNIILLTSDNEIIIAYALFINLSLSHIATIQPINSQSITISTYNPRQIFTIPLDHIRQLYIIDLVITSSELQSYIHPL